MRKPNIYKARIGIMDITHKELAFLIGNRGLKVVCPEISLAVNGGKQKKHEKIRRCINEIYEEWKAEAVKNHNVDFTKIL